MVELKLDTQSEQQPQSRRTIIVTGASRGIGAAICKRFATEEKGSRIIMISTPSGQAKAMETVQELENLNAEVVWMGFDVSTKEFPERLISELRARQIEHVDVVINNAGISTERLNKKLSKEEGLRIKYTNYRAAGLLIFRLAQDGLLSKDSSVVNVASTTGIWEDPIQPTYSKSKRLLIRLGKVMPRKLKVPVPINTVAPGLVNTDMTSELPEVAKRVIAQETPIGRLITSEEVAEAVVRLSKVKQSGQVEIVDGDLGPKISEVAELAKNAVMAELRERAATRRAQRTTQTDSSP